MSGKRNGIKQVAVPCPARLQRHMLRNLERSSKDILNSDCAKKSKEILEVLEAKSRRDKIESSENLCAAKLNNRAPCRNTSGKYSLLRNIKNLTARTCSILKMRLKKIPTGAGCTYIRSKSLSNHKIFKGVLK